MTGDLLIVEDNAIVARALTRLLGAKHQVTVVDGAQSALDLLATGRRFDLVICDLMMPRMTGVDFLMNLDPVAPDQVDRVAFITADPSHPMARLLAGHHVLDKTADPNVVRALAASFVDRELAA